MTKRRTARARKPLNLRPIMDPRNPETWGPAPADRPKPKACPVQVLARKDRITDAEQSAAREIDRVFTYISGGLMARGQRFARASRGVSPPNEKLVLAYASRYKPWADALTVQRNRHDDPTLEIVIAAVVDGRSMRDLDASYAWRNGNACRCLRNGLRLYAVMAGWQRESGTYGDITVDEEAA